MHTTIKVAVIGGTGKAGQYLVNELLQQGYTVKMLVRNSFVHPLAETVKGDVRDVAAVHALLEDCHVVISTIGQRKDEPLVCSIATENILQVMTTRNISRYILLTGLSIDVPGDHKSQHNQQLSAYMRQTYPDATADKQHCVELLSESNTAWTIVRVPVIQQSSMAEEIVVQLDDCAGDHITAADLASFMVQQINDKRYIKMAPFVAAGKK